MSVEKGMQKIRKFLPKSPGGRGLLRMVCAVLWRVLAALAGINILIMFAALFHLAWETLIFLGIVIVLALLAGGLLLLEEELKDDGIFGSGE